MKKLDLLYRSGLKPAVFSTKYYEDTFTKWHRDCTSIIYKVNSQNVYYTLSFTYNFRYAHDTVFFAYAIPYTFTDLSEYLNKIKTNYKEIARIDTLCTSLAGNPCEVVTITEKVKTFTNGKDEQND